MTTHFDNSLGYTFGCIVFQHHCSYPCEVVHCLFEVNELCLQTVLLVHASKHVHEYI